MKMSSKIFVFFAFLVIFFLFDAGLEIVAAPGGQLLGLPLLILCRVGDRCRPGRAGGAIVPALRRGIIAPYGADCLFGAGLKIVAALGGRPVRLSPPCGGA